MIHTLTMNPTIDVSTTIEEMSPVNKLRCESEQRDPGGGGINVARVLKRLGADVTAIFPAGGATGQALRKLVENEGINNVTINLSQETRLSFTVLEKKTGHEYRFLLPGPEISESEWRQCLEVFAAQPDWPAYVVISGSLPPGAPDDFYARMARVARARGSKIVIDTSGPALKAVLDEKPYLVKFNFRELRELTGETLESPQASLAACRDLIHRGQTEIVALTLGDKGALLVTAAQALHAKALPITPISTVGAGDSFLGAMLWSLLDGAEISQAFRCGVAGGSAALLRHGTELCLADDVRRLYRDVHLTDEAA